jgi:3-oxoacyl-[acyl-carrier protein] reductase
MARIIVITGAGDGLGRALAQRFAADGDQVVLLGRTQATLASVADELGGRAAALVCDVTKPDDVRAAFAEIASRFGHIDVLINNAALYDIFPIDEASDEQIVSLVNTNLVGTMFCTRAAVPLLRSGSHIINVSSDGVELPFPLMSVYQATKAGVERFTNAIQRELEPGGIRVSIVRAAAMSGGGKGTDLSPEMGARFHREAMAAGIDLSRRPVSDYKSATHAFRALIDMPDDIHGLSISLCPRHA